MGISVGFSHCLAWDAYGAIYSWGEGADGKLGNPIGEGDTEFRLFQTTPE
jgi:alpha-tubulin suppressor-like RCC1 family protein